MAGKLVFHFSPFYGRIFIATAYRQTGAEGGCMGDYVITTDSTADLMYDFIQEQKLPCIGLNFMVDEKEYSYRDRYDMKKYLSLIHI